MHERYPPNTKRGNPLTFTLQIQDQQAEPSMHFLSFILLPHFTTNA